MTALSMEFNVLPAARRMANARRRLGRVWSSAVMATCAGAVLSGALLH